METGFFVQTGHQLSVGAGNAVGRFQQAFAIGVFADGLENFTNGSLDPADVDLGGLERRRAAGVMVRLVSTGNRHQGAPSCARRNYMRSAIINEENGAARVWDV